MHIQLQSENMNGDHLGSSGIGNSILLKWVLNARSGCGTD